MSSSFWSQIRYRIGSGSMGMANRIHDMIQKQIMANADVQDVTVEEVLAPIITLPSKMTMTDKLFQASARTIAAATDCVFPIDPDLFYLRLWTKNYNGGRYLEDWSFMGNTIQLNGSAQSEMVFSTDDDGVSGSLPVNRLVDDQYIRVLDNPNVRIKEISATATGISIFIRLYVEFNTNEASFNMPGVLFSKIDTEQVDYGYAAYVPDDGSIHFVVRNAGREYTLTAPPDTVTWENIDIPDFHQDDYNRSDYYIFQPGGELLPALPEIVPYDDFCFTFQFSNGRMQIIKNGVVISDTNSNPQNTGLVGWWRLNEGGDIGNTADNPSSYTRTVFNSVTGNNGTITSATWFTPAETPSKTYLNFGGTSHLVDVTSYSAIQNLSAWTISLWYYPTSAPAPDGYLVRKGAVDTSNAWLVYHISNGSVRFSIWNATPTRFDITSAAGAIPALNRWYHIVAKVTLGTTGKIFVNNGKVTGAGNVTGTVDTGSGNPLRMGGSTTATSPLGLIHDLQIYNRELSDAEVANLYNGGHPNAGFPPWKANPPTVPPPPSATTNPFIQVYDAPQPAVAEQDSTRLHKITATSLSEKYNVSQGTSQSSTPVPSQEIYANDPAYDSGTAVQEVLSGYNTGTATPVSQTRMEINSTYFGGERFLTGSDVIGKPVTKVVCKMCDANANNAAATGNIIARIVNAAGASQAVSTNVIDASTLQNNQTATSTTAWTDCTFTFSTSYVMANGDKIQFEYDQGGTGGTPGPETLSSYQRLNGNRDSGGNILNTEYLAQVIDSTSCPFYNKVVSKVYVAMFRNTSATTKNIWAEVVKADGTVVQTSNTVAATTMSLFYPQPYAIHLTFSSPTYTMQVGDYIAIKYNFAGPSGFGSCGCFLESSGGPAGTHVYDNNNGTIDHAGNAYDISMDVYVMTPGQAKSVAIPLFITGSNLRSNAEQYDGNYGGSITNRPTNDLGLSVYFNAATGQANHQYTQLQNAGNKFVGVYVNSTAADIYGERITSVQARIYKVGSPTGTLFCRIKGSVTTTLGYNGVAGTGLDVSTLGTGSAPATIYTFSNINNGDPSTGYALAQGDRVIFELSGGTSSGSAYVQIARTTTASTVPNVHIQTSTAGTTWTSSTNDDLIGFMFVGGYELPPVNPYYTLGYVYDRIMQKISDTGATIYNQKITQVKVWLKKIGLPTGTLNVGIRKANDTFIRINSFDVSSISDIDFTLYTFTDLAQSYVLANGDRISVEYTGGNSTNHVQVNANLLSTYPSGYLELVAGSTFTSKTSYDLAGQMFSGGGASDPLARVRIGEKAATDSSAIRLKKISRITVYLKKQSTPPGSVLFRVRNAADAVVQELGSKLCSEITNSMTAYTITSSPIAVYALQTGDRVCVEYNDGDDFNFVEVMTSKTTDIFGGTVNTYLEKYDTGWVSSNAIDLVGQMWEGGDTYTPSQEDIVIPPPVYTKDLTVLAGGHPWTYIDHTIQTISSPHSQSYVNAIVPDFRFYRKLLTLTELLNLYTNRWDIGNIPFGKVTITGFFAISET